MFIWKFLDDREVAGQGPAPHLLLPAPPRDLQERTGLQKMADDCVRLEAVEVRLSPPRDFWTASDELGEPSRSLEVRPN